jgi:hypothetical protein
MQAILKWTIKYRYNKISIIQDSKIKIRATNMKLISTLPQHHHQKQKPFPLAAQSKETKIFQVKVVPTCI